MSRIRLFALMVPIVVASCSGGGAESGSVAEAGLDGPDAFIEPSTEDVYTVGAFDGEDWENFGRIRTVAFDGEGRLFIQDGDAHRFVVVDPSGQLVRTVGKQGGGPGEFQMIFSSAVFGDGSLAVVDLGNQSFSQFDAEGSFVGSSPLDLQTGAPGTRVVPLPDGRIVTAEGPRIRMSSGPPDADEMLGAEETRPIDVFTLEGGEPETIYRAWDLPEAEAGEERSLSGSGGNITFAGPRMRAFEPDLHFDVLSDGTIALVDSVGYRVKLVSLNGEVVGAVERAIAPRAATQALQDGERERRLAALENRQGANMVVMGGGGGMQIDQAQVRQMMEDQINGMVFAEEVPVISGMAVDREDRIWVRRYAEDGSEGGPIDVVTADGDYLGTIPGGVLDMPAAFGPGGLMAYIEADELDVQTVRVVRLEPLAR